MLVETYHENNHYLALHGKSVNFMRNRAVTQPDLSGLTGCRWPVDPHLRGSKGASTAFRELSRREAGIRELRRREVGRRGRGVDGRIDRHLRGSKGASTAFRELRRPGAGRRGMGVDGHIDRHLGVSMGHRHHLDGRMASSRDGQVCHGAA
jgi:hypothetical protein